MKKRVLALAIALFTLGFFGCSPKDTVTPSGPEVNPTDVIEQPTISAEYQNIINMINTICTPSENSAPATYIAEHQTEYDELIALGEESLKVMFDIFENGDETGLRGAIMQIACSDILNDEYNETQANSGDAWYSQFKGNVLQKANLNSAEFVKENYPLSYNVLTLIGYEKRVYDSSSVLKNEEISLSNGVRLSMKYEEVTQILVDNYKENQPNSTTKTILKDGCTYTFYKLTSSKSYDAGLPHDENYYLFKISMSSKDGCTLFGARDIKMNDDLFDVFGKIPAKNITLKKWAEQIVYGNPASGNSRATLHYTISSSTYSLSIKTPSQSIDMIFDKDNNLVLMTYSLEKN